MPDLSERETQLDQRRVVVVVDDEPAMCHLVARSLPSRRYCALEAHSGEEALAIISTLRQLDLLVCDLAMPTMTGPEIIALVRKTQPALKAICMSGYQKAEVVYNAHLDPAPIFLEKPFSLNQFVELVDGIFGVSES